VTEAQAVVDIMKQFVVAPDRMIGHIMASNISVKERRVYKKLFGENASHHPVWFVERTMKLE
jgi:hypothetical protein